MTLNDLYQKLVKKAVNRSEKEALVRQLTYRLACAENNVQVIKNKLEKLNKHD